MNTDNIFREPSLQIKGETLYGTVVAAWQLVTPKMARASDCLGDFGLERVQRRPHAKKDRVGWR